MALPVRLWDRAAVLSDCEHYRYWLKRDVQCERTADRRRVVFVMLNPSTADATLDDPTIRRCTAFAKRLGASALAVVNLFAYRSPSPKDLLKGNDPVGPFNDDAIRYALEDSEPEHIVAAWGARPSGPVWFRQMFDDRVAFVRCAAHERLFCLGVTAGGDPRHPLYLKSDAPLGLWPSPTPEPQHGE